MHIGGLVEDRCEREEERGGKRGRGYENNFILLFYYNINLIQFNDKLIEEHHSLA